MPPSSGPREHDPSTSRRPRGAAGAVVAPLAAFVGGSLVAGLLAAGLAVPVVALAGQTTESAVDLFEELPAELEQTPLSQQTTIRFADGTPMATYYYENRINVGLDQMSPFVRDAIVAIEDTRFYEHAGADPTGIARAFVNNLRGGDTQGASTLTQQWIKNVLLQQARDAGDEEAVTALNTANEGRKIREIRLAIAAEKQISKDQILENYLNIALFGSNNYGVEAASRHYFNSSAIDLPLEDAALLAGMVQSPTRFEPTVNPQDATERRNTVLARMLSTGRIDQAQHDAAVAVPLDAQLDVQPVSNGCADAGGSAYFCDYVTATILQDPAFGEDRDARLRTLYRGGLDITTTLDRERQVAAEVAAEDTVAHDDSSQVGASLVSVEPGTGRVVAMAQNRRYVTQESDEPGVTNINYNVDAAYGGGNGFQPGSNWKPFTLAAWLQSGRQLNDRVAAPGGTVIGFENFTSCERLDPGQEWDVSNSEGEGRGSTTVAEATYDSINTAYANMARQLDICDIRDVAISLGAHPAAGGSLTDDYLSALPSSVLGTIEVAPLTMAAAYATFASGGTYCTPVAIDAVQGPDGEDLPRPQTQCSEPLATDDYTSAEIANTITYVMENVFTNGTAASVGGIGRPAAGKTGTTDNMVQTWFSGFTPDLATSAWVGHPDDATDSLSDETIDGVERTVYGATYAAPMWKDYMEVALEGVPESDFGAPDRSLIGNPSTGGSSAGDVGDAAGGSGDSDSDSADSDSDGEDEDG